VVRFLIASAGLFAMTLAGVRAEPAPAVDRAYALVGTWHCHSAAGTDSTLTFVRNADGSLTATNLLSSGNYAAVTTAGGAARTFTERYVFDAKRQTWTDSDTWNGLYAFDFEGTAGPWTGDRWQISGRLHRNNSGGAGSPETKTYISAGPDEFQRQVRSGPGLGDLSESTCMRLGSPSPRPS
jgi:hypothetical protein